MIDFVVEFQIGDGSHSANFLYTFQNITVRTFFGIPNSLWSVFESENNTWIKYETLSHADATPLPPVPVCYYLVLVNEFMRSERNNR